MNTTSGTSSSTKSSSKYFLPWEVTKHCQDKYYLLGPANCKPGGRTLDTQTASADLSLTSAALSCCVPMQSAYDPYLPGVVSTPNPLCIIAPLVHSQCPIDADLPSTWPPPPAHPHHLLTAKYLPWPQIFVPMKFGPRLQTLVYFSLTLISVPFSCVSAFECRTPAGCTPPHQHRPPSPRPLLLRHEILSPAFPAKTYL